MYTGLLEPDQISHTQSMVAKRVRTNRANVHTHILPAIEHYFTAKKELYIDTWV